MNSIIIHISDLHISLDKKIGGEINEHDSFLTTSPEKEQSILYIDKFIGSIKREFLENKKHLLITGDLTNAGEKKEFEFALMYLQRIISELNIQKENILLIPGDHDLNRRAIENLLESNETSTVFDINEHKFANFSKFYLDFLGKAFDPDKIIFETLLIEDSFQLLGLNSCTTINLVKKLGNIPILKFEEEYKAINNTSHKKIACCHHNLTSSFENKNDGQWDSENRQSFIEKIVTLGIEFVFTGNEHSQGSKSIKKDQILTSDSGSLTSKKWDTTYIVYEISIGEDIKLKNHPFSLQKTNNNDSKYEWDIRTNRVSNHPDEFVIFEKEPPKLEDAIIEIPSSLNCDIVISDIPENTSETSAINIYKNEPLTDELYSLVKDLKLYHSGHFHWSETSRAHNWIDVSKLIEDKNNLNFVKNAIIDVIEQKQLQDKVQLIIV